jgi:hypothetical protein
MALEERDDRLQQVFSAPHEVLAKVLAVIVVTPINEDPPDSEEALKLLEARAAPLTLRYDEPMKHLVAGSVAFPASAARLPHEAD